jgi:hypothetical protein
MEDIDASGTRKWVSYLASELFASSTFRNCGSGLTLEAAACYPDCPRLLEVHDTIFHLSRTRC